MVQEEEEEESPDYLFVITQGFNVALICHNLVSNSLEVVSRGKIAEMMHERKDPPYPIFLGQTGNFIALMLYHNIIKVIPLVRTDASAGHHVVLSHAMNIRVRHSNVLQVIPLEQELNSESTPSFGILYQKTEHVKVPGTSGPPALQVRREFEKHIYDREKGDLIF